MFQMTISSRDEVEVPYGDDDEMNQGYSLLQQSYKLRSGQQRITTPDKEVLVSISNSVRKHRLKKHQQLLYDITNRCREQEVREMSDAITTKCTLSNSDEKQSHTRTPKELALYTGALYRTNNNRALFARENVVHRNIGVDMPEKHPSDTQQNVEIPKLFERSATYFPPRQVKKTPRRYASPFKSFPQLQIRYQKGVAPNSLSARHRLLKQVKINGSVQMELYEDKKNNKLSPLVLPRINNSGKLEEYFKSRKVNLELGPRTRSIILEQVPAKEPVSKHGKARLCLKDAASTGHVTVRSGSTEYSDMCDVPRTAPAGETTDEPNM